MRAAPGLGVIYARQLFGEDQVPVVHPLQFFIHRSELIEQILPTQFGRVRFEMDRAIGEFLECPMLDGTDIQVSGAFLRQWKTRQTGTSLSRRSRHEYHFRPDCGGSSHTRRRSRPAGGIVRRGAARAVFWPARRGTGDQQ